MAAMATAGATIRTVVVVSADAVLRQRLRMSLSSMRWHVRDAAGGAEALAQIEEQPAEAVLLDAWLPDLEVGEIAAQIGMMQPETEVLQFDGGALSSSHRSPRRHELLHALRESIEVPADLPPVESDRAGRPSWDLDGLASAARVTNPVSALGIDELVGGSAAMMEMSRLVRLVAPKTATVLIEGETGTGKEVVARAIHRLSMRSQRSFIVLNCAAIPEYLLEAELFGHTRGAFTGAVQARTGRIEAAHGGTLFLDEIGEMPLSLQAKMLRFLESGEIQRVGDNDVTRVDVRVIAATHRNLEKNAAEGTFRLDLYHRLDVFPIDVPPLRERLEDVEALAEHFLAALGRTSPRKYLAPGALDCLKQHLWPGNVRELAHVLERAAILAGESPLITHAEIRMRRTQRT
jgi:DNA-binding NtrC family response regulator